MSLIRVESFTISLDGYGAGPDQSREAPMGRGGQGLPTADATHLTLTRT